MGIEGLLWLLLPVAAASGWWVAQKKPQKRGQTPFPDDYIHGLNYLLTDQSDRALDVFIRLVDVDPDTVETHLILGNLYRRRGEVDRAIRIHQNLLEKKGLQDRHRASALLELGRDFMQAGVFNEAERLFRDLLALGFFKAEAYSQLRSLHEQEKEWAKAIAVCEQLAEVTDEPQNVLIAHYHCEIGEAAFAKAETQRGAEHARRALSFDHDCVRASLLLADIAQSQGNSRQAIEHLRRVLQQDTRFAALVLERAGKAFAFLGDELAFEQFLYETIEHDTSITAAMALVEQLLKKQKRDALDQFLDQQMGESDVSLRLVLAYLKHRGVRRLGGHLEVRERVVDALQRFLEDRPLYHCQNCGFRSKTHFWHCPSCSQWSTVIPNTKGPQTRVDSVLPKLPPNQSSGTSMSSHS